MDDKAGDVLAQLTALTKLVLSGTCIGARGVRALAAGPARLRELDLHENEGVMADAAAALHGFASCLFSLNITNCPVCRLRRFAGCSIRHASSNFCRLAIPQLVQRHAETMQ